MATKTISARLKLDGEAELRANLKAINAEYKNLQTELELVKVRFGENNTAQEAVTAKAEAVAAAVAKQQEKFDLYNKALEEATRYQKQYAEEAETFRKELAEMGERTDENAEAYDELNRQLEEAEENQQKAANSVTYYTGECSKSELQIEKLNASLKEQGEQSTQTGQELDRLATVAYMELKQASEKLTESIRACIDEAIDFESAITGVFKTVDGTSEQLEAIAQGIVDMSLAIPATSEEIAAVAESAGQLGIATEDVLSFTEVMINLGNATNLSADEAASSLAKFANVTQMSADDYERLGSAIVALGNNMATTEADIVAMGTNIASAGEQVGLTEAQIMGMAAALSSVGLEAQAGGTAISKLMIQMASDVETGSDALTQYAEVAGMTADEFAELFGSDASAALSAFFTGLGSSSESAISILSDLGIEETRLRDTMLRLASSGDLFTEALEISTSAWEKNTALTEEANKRYETTESKVQLLKNALSNLERVIGNELTPVVANAAEVGADVLTVVSEFLEEHPAIVAALSGITAGLTAVTAVFAGFTIIKSLTPMITAFNAALAANPAALVAVGITAAVAAVGTLVAVTASASNELDELTEAATTAQEALVDIQAEQEQTVQTTEATATAASSYIARLEELEAQGEMTAEEQREYNLLVEKLTALLPELNIEIDEQTGLIAGGTEALHENIQAWKDAAVQEALYASQKELIEEQANVVIERTENEMELEAKQAELRSKYAQARQEIMDYAVTQYRMTEEAASDYANALVDEAEATGNITDLCGALVGVNGELGISIQTLWEDTGVLTESITVADGVIAEYDAQMQGVQDTLDSYTESQNGANDAASASTESQQELVAGWQTSAESITTSAQSLITAYNEAYTAAYNLVTESIKLFEDMSSRTTSDIGDMTENQKSQATFYEEYQSALTGALAKIPPEMQSVVLESATMTEESLADLQAIANGSDEEVADLVEAFEETQEAQRNLATAIAEAETDFSQSKDDIIADAQELEEEMDNYSGFYDQGVNTMQGYIDGMRSKLAELQSLASEVSTLANGGSTSSGSGSGSTKNSTSTTNQTLYVVVDGKVVGQTSSTYQQTQTTTKNRSKGVTG